MGHSFFIVYTVGRAWRRSEDYTLCLYSVSDHTRTVNARIEAGLRCLLSEQYVGKITASLAAPRRTDEPTDWLTDRSLPALCCRESSSGLCIIQRRTTLVFFHSVHRGTCLRVAQIAKTRDESADLPLSLSLSMFLCERCKVCRNLFLSPVLSRKVYTAPLSKWHDSHRPAFTKPSDMFLEVKSFQITIQLYRRCNRSRWMDGIGLWPP